MPARTFLGSCGYVSFEDTVQDGWYQLQPCFPSVFLEGQPKQVSGQLKPAKSHIHSVSWPKKSWESSGNQELILEWFLQLPISLPMVWPCVYFCLVSCVVFLHLCNAGGFVDTFSKAQHCCVSWSLSFHNNVDTFGELWKSVAKWHRLFCRQSLENIRKHNRECFLLEKITYRSMHSSSWKGIFNIFSIFSVSWLI